MLIESPVQCFMNECQGNFVSKCMLATVIHFGRKNSIQAKYCGGSIIEYVGLADVPRSYPLDTSTVPHTQAHMPVSLTV